MDIKLILFDIDGTLVNSFPPYTEIMNKLLPIYNIKPTAQILKHTFPMTIDQTMQYLNMKKEDKDLMLERYLKISRNINAKDIPYPHVEEVLNEIINHYYIKLGIVTSRSDPEMKNVVNELPILKSMDVLVSSDTVSQHKPSPMPINYALDKLKLKPEETLYIGDAKTDFQAANNAKVHFAAALWGTKDPQAFANTMTLTDFKGVLQIIDNK